MQFGFTVTCNKKEFSWQIGILNIYVLSDHSTAIFLLESCIVAVLESPLLKTVQVGNGTNFTKIMQLFRMFCDSLTFF